MQTALTQLHMQIEFLRRMEKLPSAVYLVSSLQRGMKSHFAALLLSLSSQRFHTQRVELNTIIPEAAHLLGRSEARARTVLVTFGRYVFVPSLRSLQSGFVPLPTELESLGWAGSPLQRPEGKQDRAAAAMGSTANSDYSSFPFLFKNTVLTWRDRGMEREQNRAPSWGMGLGLPQQHCPWCGPCRGLAPRGIDAPVLLSAMLTHNIHWQSSAPCQCSLPRDSSSSSLTSPPLPVSHKLLWSVSAALIPLHKTNEHTGVSLIEIRKSVMWWRKVCSHQKKTNQK